MSTDSDLISLSGDPEMVARARRALAVAFDGDAVKITNALIDYQGTYPDLRTYVVMELEEHLPPYMVPWSVRALESLPRTSHGKLDRSALAGRLADE